MDLLNFLLNFNQNFNSTKKTHKKRISFSSLIIASDQLIEGLI